MPVMDKDKKPEEVHENEEEKRRNAVKNEQEKTPQKLLPFLNVKAEFHHSRIDTLNEKIAVREDKIARNKAKIEKLSVKADKLADRNEMLKNTFGNNPVVKKLIEKNEQKINAIRKEKIPKRQEKIKIHQNKVKQLSDKRDKIQHKFDRVVALSDTIRSFSIKFNKERREVFTDAMDRLNAANADCLTDKLNNLQNQKQQLVDTYNLPETSSMEKLNLTAKIKTLSDKISSIGNKINKLSRPENHFAEQTNDAVDAAMKVTSDKIKEMPETPNIPELAETVVEKAESIENMELSEVAELAENFKYMKNTEMSVEDDYNSIDGIINNGSKEDLLNKRNELMQNISAEMSLIKNPHIREDFKDYAKEDIEFLKADLQKIDKALEQFPETRIPENKTAENNTPEQSTVAVKKINTDYYKSLLKSNRWISTETNENANKIMEQLDRHNIRYSAIQKKSGISLITVSKADIKAYKAIANEVKSERAKQYVSPDFYKNATENVKAQPEKSNEKSAEKPVYISRETLKKSAQRLKNSKSQEQPKSNSKKQELN